MSSAFVKSDSFIIPLDNDLFLRGNVHVPERQDVYPVIIVCHGFKGYKDWNFFPYVSDKLAMEGFCAIRFNFSCNGVSGTKDEFDELDKFSINTYSREQADLSILLQHVKERKLPFANQFDLESIGIIGHSRGGGNSIIFASEHPEIKAVVTWNSVSNVDFWDDELKKEIREKGIGYIINARTKQKMPMKANVFDDIEKNKERFDILSKLKAMTTPVLIIQGDADYPHLVEGAFKMKDTASHHSLKIIARADHTFNAVHPLNETTPQLQQAIAETVQFFKKKLT